MRLPGVFILLLLAAITQAQIPTFSSLKPREALKPASEQLIRQSFRSFERVGFEETLLLNYLQSHPQNASARLELGTYSWDVELTSFDLRSPDYTLLVQSETGISSVPRSASPTYRGYTEAGEKVILTIADGFVKGWVDVKDGAIHFQSAWLVDEANTSNDLIIYREADGILPADRECEALHPDQLEPQGFNSPSGKTQLNKTSVGLCRQVQLAVASDYSMYTAYGSNVTTLEARNLSVMAAVEVDYGTSFVDDYFFQVVQQFISTCTTCDPWTSSTVASTLLSSFTNWGGFTATHDLGQLWTRRNFNGSTVGIAWVGAVCTNSRYHTIQDFTPNANLMRVTTSHEIGHNFDCDHDASGSTFIMAPAVQNTTTWSPLSITSVNVYAPTRSCLSTVSCTGGGGSSGTAPFAAFNASPRTICPGQAAAFTNTSTGATSYLWTFLGGSPATSTLPNPQVSYSQPGSYTVTLVATNSFGSTTKQELNYITVVPTPQANFSVTNLGGFSYQFTSAASGATNFQWDFGDGFTSTAQNPSHTYAQGGLYNVFLTVLSGCGSNSISQQLNVLPPPTAAFTANQRQGCAPMTVDFSDQSAGSPTSFLWTFTGGTPSSSTQRNPRVVYAQPGSYTVQLVVSNSVGNNSRLEPAFINVSTAPTAGFGVSVNGASINVINQASVNTNISYTFGDGSSSNQASPGHVYTQPGTYTITQTIASVCGPIVATRQVTIIAPPIAAFSVSATNLCPQQPVTITSTSTGVPTSYVYTVQQPNGVVLTSTQNPFMFLPTQTGTYGISLTVSNSVGQNSTSNSAAFTVLAAPVAGFNFNLAGLTAIFTGSVNPILPGASPLYSWTFGDGQSGSGANPSHNYASAGQYNVVLTANNGCQSSSESRTITVGAAPTASISRQGTGAVCVGTTVSYTATVSGNASSITWNLPGSSNPSPSGTAVQVSYAQAGSYPVEVTICNQIGCNTSTLSGGIIVQTTPSAGFLTSVNGATVSVTSNASGATNTTYTFAAGVSFSTPNANYTYTQGGVYTITQTVSNACGQSSFSQNITIAGAPSLSASATQSGPYCAGAVISLLATVTGSATSIIWNVPGASVTTLSGANVQVSFPAPGSYVASVTACNSLGCSLPAFVQPIVVYAAPQAGLSTSISGLTINVSSSAQNANTFLYDFGDGNSSSQANAVYTYAQGGTYRILQTVSSQCGQDTTSRLVTVGVAPSANFNVNAGCVAAPVSFLNSSTGSPTAYLWSFPGGTPASSTSVNPSVVYTQPGNYTVSLTVTNSFGSNTITRPQALQITSAPTANFTLAQNGSTITLSPSVTNTSNFSWDFGNGVTAAGTTTSYTYPSPGSYLVKLLASGPCGNVQATQSVVVQPPLRASLSVGSTQSCPGDTVQYFSANTTGATSLQWSFPGGNPSTSSLANPKVVYSQRGNYSALLIARNSSGADTASRANIVEVLDAPLASFSVSTLLLKANFTNTSSLATSYLWDFGNGTQSTSPSPEVTYAVDGVYTVTLIATGPCGTDSQSQTVSVTLGGPVARFTSSTTEGCAPLTVTLTDLSENNPTSWIWTLSTPVGTTLTSSLANPTFVLDDPGQYSVSLQASNSTATSTSFQNNVITVFSPPTALARVLKTSGLTVNFTSVPTQTDSIQWNFGDGTFSSATSPEHTYAQGGLYSVIFSVFGACGVDSSTMLVDLKPNSLGDLPPGASIRLFPNPATSTTNLEMFGFPQQRIQLEVRDALGKIHHQEGVELNSALRQNLDCQDWAPGFYTIRIHGADLDYSLPMIKME